MNISQMDYDFKMALRGHCLMLGMAVGLAKNDNMFPIQVVCIRPHTQLGYENRPLLPYHPCMSIFLVL